jgi:hypothetical protein
MESMNELDCMVADVVGPIHGVPLQFQANAKFTACQWLAIHHTR